MPQLKLIRRDGTETTVAPSQPSPMAGVVGVSIRELLVRALAESILAEPIRFIIENPAENGKKPRADPPTAS